MITTQQQFIKKIAPIIQKQAARAGYKICSPVIAQACLESRYGKSNKAKYYNYFGLKYRPNRVPCSIGYFIDSSVEQNKNGTYRNIEDKWFKFNSMETGCRGYYEFLNMPNYRKLKSISNPKQYLQQLINAKYATDLKYVEKVYQVIIKYNLTQYDKKKKGAKKSNIQSPLIDYKKISPNQYGKRNHTIDRITPHCVVGQMQVQSLGNMFAQPAKQASCNYAIGTDGRVLLCVPEANASWCSSSKENDERAVTIECASDAKDPYTFNNKVYNKLIKLCVDICKRNGKKKLIWISNKQKALTYQPKSDEMLLTVHRWFKNKACPGQWMMDHMDDLAQKVTEALGGDAKPAKSTSKPKKTQTKPTKPAAAKTTKPFLVKILTASLNIRSGAGLKYTVQGRVKQGQTFTIVEEKNGWGRLKSGAGWISLNSAYVKRL